MAKNAQFTQYDLYDLYAQSSNKWIELVEQVLGLK